VPALKISLLGPPQLEYKGDVMKFDTRKNVALLAYLAVTKSPHSRESLTTLLWPDMEPSRARSGLRRNLSILRKTLGDRWLQVDRESVALELSEDSWFDMDNFHYLLTAWKEHGHLGTEVCARCLPSLEEAVELYRGDFLEGFILRDNPNFDEWQFFQAEGLRRELASALEHLVMGYTAQEEFDLAILYARRWLALDNLRESVQRTLMRLYTWSGQRAAALRQYIEYERLLKQELGLTAEEETTQLYQTIREKGELSPPESHLVPFRPTHITLNERYQLEDEISSGGAGRVYSAYDNLLDREVVVKLYSDTTLGSEGRNHLLKEAQAAARLNHPNIVAIYDACEVDSTFFIVMERVEGITLAEWEPASLEEILKITRQICTGLSHAHTNGIIHRDLKPENILLGVDGIIKLTDFGLARSIATRLTSEGIITGTVFYLAPELALGQDFDGRADLYALGVMLYEFVTNQLPFSADDPIAVISQHIHAPVVPPRALKAEIPPVLDALITSLLSKNPADRPISAEMVLAKLSTPDILDVEASPVEELTLLNRIGRGRLVGRDEELQICRGYWSRALASQGQLLLISGEAGIGKTRLVRELETLAEISGGWVLKGACYAEGGVPYSPFTQIIRQAFEKGFIEDFDIPSFVLADLLVLAPVLRLKYTMTKTEQAPVDPKSEQQQLFENLAIFINLLSYQAPLLLILEDLHWADSSTLCLMRHLARQTLGRRAMIVATYRHTEVGELHPIHPVLLDLHREGLLSQLLLPRLDREQTEKLLATMFAQEVPAVFLDGIYRETEGNPFFIEEVCKSLMDRGKVYYEDGRWRGRRMEEMEIPQSVRVAIQSRVGVLPLISQQQLRLAAVVGREFEFDTLAKASNQDEEILIEALDNAERAQLIGYVSDVGGGSYTFVHTLIPATLVESARPLQRRRLHHQVAAAIEALYPDNYEALAYHYQQGKPKRRLATHY
jgi:DNA-binding SARP family transcriptional activator/tRNA A-37 threonylcarbamoyl transferase component Bud32